MVNKLTRIFKYNGQELADPNNNMTTFEVGKYYSDKHPALLTCTCSDPQIIDGKAIYTFDSKPATKG